MMYADAERYAKSSIDTQEQKSMAIDWCFYF